MWASNTSPDSSPGSVLARSRRFSLSALAALLLFAQSARFFGLFLGLGLVGVERLDALQLRLVVRFLAPPQRQFEFDFVKQRGQRQVGQPTWASPPKSTQARISLSSVSMKGRLSLSVDFRSNDGVLRS